MVNFKGVATCLCVSMFCAPITTYCLSHSILQNVLTMYIFQYTLFLTVFAIFMYLLKPNSKFGALERRGSLLYFLCCMFTCIAVSQLAVQAKRFNMFGKPKKPLKYFVKDELYLKTPFGKSSEFSYLFFTFLMSLLMVFQMDNCSSPRNIALYWGSFTVTKTLVTGIGLLSSTFVTKLQFSSIVSIFFFLVSLWVLHYFLVKCPRFIPCQTCFTRGNGFFDTAIVMGLAFSAGFNFFRILALLNSSQKYIKLYEKFEPYMKHSSKFGTAWVLVCAALNIPCCLVAIHSLFRCILKRHLDMSLIHAGSMFQGTLVYLSYDWFPAADKKGRIPEKYYDRIVALNIFVVVVAHVYMLRCMWKHKPDFDVKCSRVNSEDEQEETEEEEELCYGDDDDDDNDDDDNDNADDFDEDEEDEIDSIKPRRRR